MGEKLLVGSSDNVEGEVGLCDARMCLLVTWLKELGGVLLARNVVNVLEQLSCEPCCHWRGIKGQLSEKEAGANDKQLSSPTVEALVCDPDDCHRQKGGDREAHLHFEGKCEEGC